MLNVAKRNIGQWLRSGERMIRPRSAEPGGRALIGPTTLPRGTTRLAVARRDLPAQIMLAL
jgi:hypothetical protein